jgi:hypothetical protein
LFNVFFLIYKTIFRCPEEFHFDGESDDIEFFEMQEGDEIELFWDGINERNHERKYYSLLTGKINRLEQPDIQQRRKYSRLSARDGSSNVSTDPVR